MPAPAPVDATTDQSIRPIGVLAAAIAVTTWGLSGVVIKDIDMDGIAIAGYRFTIYGLVTGAVLALRGNRPSIRVMRESMWGGIALAVDVAFFFSAVKLTTLANATVIGALQPVVVGIAAAVLFGETIRRREVGLAGLALIGVVVVVLGASDEIEASLTGDLFAFVALLAWSAYFVFVRKAKDRGRVTPAEYTFGAALWVGMLNLPLALAFGQDLSWPSTDSWVGLLILTFGAGILGHSLMNWALHEIPLWVAATFTLFIPVAAAAAAWAYLGEPLTTLQVLAMGIVLLALTGIVTSRSGLRNRPRPLRR
ncbi:MAG: drug/metabolite transporter (DMT)-like permease [Candidatus Poriferisodalaceae bacterium]|jgi:drug/metabolite transporter (DMT)-like permease